MIRSTSEEGRLALWTPSEQQHVESFRDALREGLLGAGRKSLPCRFLYDTRGAELFDAICDVPEYYVTRTERSILEASASAIYKGLPANLTLVELGSGASRKTRLLIEAGIARQGALHFVPIDIATEMLACSSRELLRDYPELTIEGVAGEYQQGLRWLSTQGTGAKLVAWLGSSIGNFPRDEAARFLRSVSETLGPDDVVLVGIDMRKDARTLELAYDDPTGVTRAFILNILERANRECGANFDPNRFRMRARWKEEAGHVSIDIESLCEQSVEIGALRAIAHFRAGERIFIEHSVKYSPAEIETLAARAGLVYLDDWHDAASAFTLALFGKAQP